MPGAMPSRDANGRALPAKFRFYEPDTALTTVASVYTASDLLTAHEFPLLSDSAGRWPQIWADEALSFDVGWSDQVNDATIAVYTDVSPAADAVLASTDLSESYADDAADSATAAAASETAASTSAMSAAASALAAAAAQNGLNVRATSTSSVLIGTGTKVFTLAQTDMDFAHGMDVEMSDNLSVLNRMVGTVDTFVDPVLTVVVPVGGTTGSGTYGNWTVALTAIGGVISIAGLSSVISAAALKTALAIASTDITDFEEAVFGLALAAQR